jgi:pyruvate dehydrogenase E2 component (dihydrolipoamide acetyltransferase)
MAKLQHFKLPDVGEGLTEADIIKWHVHPGDTVEVNQTIVEIETAKAVVELPCPFEGVVAELLVEEGQTVDVGVPIIAVDVAPGDTTSVVGGGQDPESYQNLAKPETPAKPAEPAEPAGSAPAGEKRQPVLVGYGVKPGATKRRPRKQGPAPEPTRARTAPPAAEPTAAERGTAERVPAEPAESAASVAAESPAAAPGRVAVLAKPPVRKLAKDLGVDLTTLTGSGPQGSITREDVQAAAASPAAAPGREPMVRPVTPGAGEERIAVKGVRKHTAAAMVRSAFTAPHVTEFLQVDVTDTMAAVRRLRSLADFADVKVSPLLLVGRALLTAVRRYPMINASWDEQTQEIVVKHYVNLGIAAATERGLIVPNIKDAHAMSLVELATGLQRLTETARAGKAQPADLSGGTITITNVGVFGVDTGTPILTPGEVAILAFGQIRDMPWVHDGEIKVRKVTTLALSFDHRVIDGELGSAALRDIGAMLEDPLRTLAWT